VKPTFWYRRAHAGLSAGKAGVAALALVALSAVPLASSAAATPAKAAVKPRAVTCGSSACDWAEYHQNPDLLGYASNSPLSTANASELGVAWATNLYSAALDSPAVAYDSSLGETLAYIGTESGNMEAVNVATGQIVWGTWVGAPIRTTPVVVNGTVWFGTFDSPRVYSLNASTGAIECSVAAPQPIEGTPVAADPPGGVPTIYIGTNDDIQASGPMLAIAQSNCAIEWTFEGFNMIAGSWSPAAYTLTASGVPLVIFGTADPDSTLYAVNAVTGVKVWEYTVANPPPGVYDIGAGALVSPPGDNGFADGAVYVPTKYGIMYALDLTTGALIWQTNFDQIAGITQGEEGGRSTPALDGTNLVFGYAGGMFDLNALSGAVVWQYIDPSDTEVLGGPAIAGPSGQEIVAAGDVAGGVDVVSLATGAALYHYQTGGYITAGPAVTDGNILINSSDGFLYDFAVGGGNESTLPTTSITSPADGSSIPNPNGNLAISGTAADTDGVAGVVLAIQQDGPAGEWWNAAKSTWSTGPMTIAATLASSGATSTTWSYEFPAPATGGSYTIDAYTESVGGQSDIKGSSVGIAIAGSTKGAHVKASPLYVAPGANVTITGAGFKAGETVTLSLVGTTLGTTTVNSKGNITAITEKIPSNAVFGPSAVTATGATSGRVAAAPFTVANAWAQLNYGPSHDSFEANDPTLYNLVHPGGNIFVDLAWSYQAGAAVDTSPAVADDVAYIGDNAGNLTAVDVHNGAPIWTWSLPSGDAIGGSPAVDPLKSLVFVGADDGTLDAISTSTGKLVWSDSIGGDVSAPVLGNDEIYVTSNNGTIEAVAETTGVETWSKTLASVATSPPTLDATAKLLVVGEANGHVQELNATTGALGWVFDAAGAVTASPSIDNGEVYFGSAGKTLYAVSETEGTVKWTFTTTAAVDDTPALTNQLTPNHGWEVLVGDAQGHLYYVDASDGTELFVTSFPGSVTGVAAVKGVAVAELSSGLITSVRSYVDLDVWKYRTQSTLSTVPVVDDGTIYVGAADGHLYAFTSYGQPPV
jgi:outer membrane protein assembly factor BamB